VAIRTVSFEGGPYRSNLAGVSEHDFWQAILYLHLLAMAFFVGGQLVFGIAVVPILRQDPDRERMRAVARRFGYGSLIALGVLVATGWAMASHYDLFSSSTLQWKLGLVAVVIGLTLLHLRWPKLHALQGAILLASLVVVWLGLELAVSG
jgi:putative copper export protein